MTETPNRDRARAEVRRLMREVGRRLDQWDPIGVYADVERPPPGEYECLVGPVVRMLHDGATSAAIAGMLTDKLVDHFGLDLTASPLGLAQDLRLWWDGEGDRP